MIKAITDYKDILKKHFEKKVKLNARYSLRAFARDIDISSARLSHVMNGKYGLSVKAGEQIAKRLGMSKNETHVFCNLIAAQHARSVSAKNKAKELLKKSDYIYSDIEVDTFKVISDWYHFAIVELINTKDFKYTNKWIGSQLGITEAKTKEAIERLIKVGLITEKNGTISPCSRFYVNQKGISHESIKNYHRQILDKAKLAIDSQSIDVRDFGSLTIAISEEDIPFVKEKLKEFRNYLDQELSKKTDRKYVYQLGTQFYCLQTLPPQLKNTGTAK
jgi:uncharacterized protein (TIGR02147 family)